MASSLSRKLSSAIFPKHLANFSLLPNPSPLSFLTQSLSSSAEPDSEPLLAPDSSSFPPSSNQQHQGSGDRPLENGLDLGIYKAILIGQVGQPPIQKKLKSGRFVTLISLGTGGIRNNRRPLDNEDPKDYANRCAVQWHRVSIYPERMGELAAKNLVRGSVLYVEGNLETKIFNDPITGLVRRIREVAVRRNGRILFLGNGDGEEEAASRVGNIGGVGYF